MRHSLCRTCKWKQDLVRFRGHASSPFAMCGPPSHDEQNCADPWLESSSGIRLKWLSCFDCLKSHKLLGVNWWFHVWIPSRPRILIKYLQDGSFQQAP